MAFTFDGVNKIISISTGTTAMDIRDFYSRWKDWAQSAGSRFLQACSVVGGDPIDEAAGIYVSTYIFLENGWRIRPAECSHTLRVYNGILLTPTGDDPFIPTQGSYNVQIKYSQPVAAQSVVIETGTSGLTTEESEQLASLVEVNEQLVEANLRLEKTLTTKKFLALK